MFGVWRIFTIYEDAYREVVCLYARIKTGLDTDIETINNTIEL